MPETPNVCLRLPNRPENVLIVRQALSGLAATLPLDAIESNDLNTAVTEACNNVAMHAYEGAEGPLEVDVCVDDAIAVLVRDRGVGRSAREGHGRGANGIGLAVIDALARRVEFTEPAGGGTEVRMEFPLPSGAGLEPILGEDLARGPAAAGVHASAIEVWVAPRELAREVLPRVLSALAARAHFSTDRISDVRIVADVLAAHAGDALDGSHLAVGVTTTPRELDLRIGPLLAGRGESLVAAAADGQAPVIERLTDDRRVAPDGAGETLELRLLDQR